MIPLSRSSLSTAGMCLLVLWGVEGGFLSSGRTISADCDHTSKPSGHHIKDTQPCSGSFMGWNGRRRWFDTRGYRWSSSCCVIVLATLGTDAVKDSLEELPTKPNSISWSSVNGSVGATKSQRIDWMGRAKQLYEYYIVHGHTRVPKRYKENPALGNWVSKQRQHYRNHRLGRKPCSLTPQRIEILNRINFCWNASSLSPVDSSHGSSAADDAKISIHVDRERVDSSDWWSRFEEVRRSKYNKFSEVPRNTRLGGWIKEQQERYAPLLGSTKPGDRSLTDTMSDPKLAALFELDPDWWMSRREWQWEVRFRQLRQYRQQHGDCCVPISFKNKQLANWVSNQRKQHNLRKRGKVSDMTSDRQERLDAIGFAWNRWDYDFGKKDTPLSVQYSGPLELGRSPEGKRSSS